MNAPILSKVSAYLLFATTLATIAVMWQPVFWATAMPEVAALCLAAAWIVCHLIHRQKLEVRFVLFSLIAAALWPVLQLAAGTTIYPWATSVSVLYWATAAAIVFIGLQIFADPDSAPVVLPGSGSSRLRDCLDRAFATFHGARKNLLVVSRQNIRTLPWGLLSIATNTRHLSNSHCP